jgi:hypothetical protein
MSACVRFEIDVDVVAIYFSLKELFFENVQLFGTAKNSVISGNAVLRRPKAMPVGLSLQLAL